MTKTLAKRSKSIGQILKALCPKTFDSKLPLIDTEGPAFSFADNFLSVDKVCCRGQQSANDNRA